MECSITEWVESEFENINLSDKRLSKRFKIILIEFMKKSQENICSTFKTWANMKGCYRFITNAKVTEKNIHACHREKTLKRINEVDKEEHILLIQDTTYFDYHARHKTVGLDCVIKSPKSDRIIEGLMLHNTLAITTQGIPLGLYDQQFVERQKFHGPNPRKLRYWNNPIYKKESYRWIKTIEDFHSLDIDKSRVIHIADREGDIYELYRDCADMEEKFIIRAKVNRSINKKKRRESPKEKLFDSLEAKKSQGNLEIRTQVNAKTKYRTAELSVIYERILIPPPPNKTIRKDGHNLPNVEVWAIMAIERKPPKDMKAIKWVLITNMPINSLKDAIEKVTWYSYRWNIEVFHKILKSGCSVEKAQLRDGERLKKYIIMKSIVAWRIFWMTRTFEKNKDESCETVLSKSEYEILYRKFNQNKLPEAPPTIKEIYYWIAKLGGFINRRSDGSPGIISIWKGWIKFMEVIDNFLVFCG